MCYEAPLTAEVERKFFNWQFLFIELQTKKRQLFTNELSSRMLNARGVFFTRQESLFLLFQVAAQPVEQKCQNGSSSQLGNATGLKTLQMLSFILAFKKQGPTQDFAKMKTNSMHLGLTASHYNKTFSSSSLTIQTKFCTNTWDRSLKEETMQGEWFVQFRDCSLSC